VASEAFKDERTTAAIWTKKPIPHFQFNVQERRQFLKQLSLKQNIQNQNGPAHPELKNQGQDRAE
jgi:hypothetical protein